MGEVVDKEKAENSVCYCSSYSMNGEERELCWSKGVIGALSDNQKVTMCTPEMKEPLPEKVNVKELRNELIGPSKAVKKALNPE